MSVAGLYANSTDFKTQPLPIHPLQIQNAGRRRSRKWIQKAVAKMDKGAFTKQALRVGSTPMAFKIDVLAHPKKHTLKTRRRAQFLKNVLKRSQKVSRRK
jgi:hypothetical protein